jgi:hypothetical protein
MYAMLQEYHQGVMTTVVDDCQFVCITQSDYYKILHEGEDALVKETDADGVLVKVRSSLSFILRAAIETVLPTRSVLWIRIRNSD